MVTLGICCGGRAMTTLHRMTRLGVRLPVEGGPEQGSAGRRWIATALLIPRPAPITFELDPSFALRCPSWQGGLSTG